jgi:hypothetical protein
VLLLSDKLDELKNKNDQVIKGSELAVECFETICRPLKKMVPKPVVISYLIRLGARISRFVDGQSRL